MTRIPLICSLLSLAMAGSLLVLSTWRHLFVTPEARAQGYLSDSLIVVEHDYYGIVVAICIMAFALAACCVAYCESRRSR